MAMKRAISHPRGDEKSCLDCVSVDVLVVILLY